ncbi:tail fiber protein [Xylophilus sp. GW821-FHT01B05]
MSNPFVAEIRIVTFNFAPTGWAQCNGQLMPISQNTALFSLLGTNYGGDGNTTFALPNFQGSFPLHQGQGPSLSSYDIGQIGGASSVTLLSSELPSHSHNIVPGAPANAAVADPQGAALGASPSRPYSSTAAPSVAMSPAAVGVAGAGQPHNNLPPYLVLNFIIAMQGIFPSRP